jgi:lipoate-protein ligase A
VFDAPKASKVGKDGKKKKTKRGGTRIREAREKAKEKWWNSLTEEQRQEIEENQKRVAEILQFAKENEVKNEEAVLTDEEIKLAVDRFMTHDHKVCPKPQPSIQGTAPD